MMDPEIEQKIDTIILETNSKLEAIVEEMRIIKSSDLDDVSKHQKTDSLRHEFESVLNEQQKRVDEVMKNDRFQR